MYQRLISSPKSSFFLFGPRGTGKTTWLKSNFPDVRRFDLLDETLYQRYLSNVSAFQHELNITPQGAWVIIDEVQRLPHLLNEVHRAMEERKLKFALTGSSARKLKRQGTNLLAGRALWRQMYPLVPEEMGEDFDLAKTLSYGTLPLMLASPQPEEQLEAYTRLYLREEIQNEALVRNLAGFARFLPIAALAHGQVLSISSLSRDAEVSRTTIDGYVSVLEDTLVAHRLPAYEAKLRVRERKHPKFYWIDPGIPRALKQYKGPAVSEEKGPLLEGYMYMMLTVYKEHRALCDSIHYWSATEARGVEVDFLLKRRSELIAVEVKSSATIRPEHFKGLNAISTLKGIKRRLLVYLGSHQQKTDDGVEILPFSVFSRMLAQGEL